MANKIIVITGPHEGVGKTTLAVNLAARYAQARRLPVVLIDTDASCRGETAQIAGAAGSPSVFSILEQLASKQLTLPMLRGRIALNRLNIGAIALSLAEAEIRQLTLERWSFFIQAVSQIFDLVIDLEVASPFKVTSLDLADGVVWTLLPNVL